MAWNPYLDEWAGAHGSRVRGWIGYGQLGADLQGIERSRVGRILSTTDD
jgi:hypothetical protein